MKHIFTTSVLGACLWASVCGGSSTAPSTFSSQVDAQSAKRARIFPFNYRNDVRQPVTLEQIRQAFQPWVPMTTAVSWGTWTMELVVYPYVTLDADKPSNPCAPNQTALTAALATHNAPTDGIKVLVSPTTFGAADCDAASPNYATAFIGFQNMEFKLIHAFNVGGMANAALCTDATGAFVTVRGTCTFAERNRMTWSGQGDGRPGAAETSRLGLLPLANVVTIDALPVGQSQRITIAPLEQKSSSTQWVHVVPMGLSLEYHQDGPNGGWQEQGLTGHRLQSSSVVDFTPDGRFWWPGQAGESALAVGKSYVNPTSRLRITTLSATGTGAELYLDHDGDVLPK